MWRFWHNNFDDGYQTELKKASITNLNYFIYFLSPAYGTLVAVFQCFFLLNINSIELQIALNSINSIETIK